jgi:hypothetical protein
VPIVSFVSSPLPLPTPTLETLILSTTPGENAGVPSD